jgi:DNA-binding SARP family transcriptional activator
VDFGLLGPLAVRNDAGQDLAIGGPLPRALLTILLLAEGRAVTTESLLDQLWDGDPGDGAQATLHSTISRLRRTLEPGGSRAEWTVLRSEAGSYRLTVPVDSVDVARFERLADEGRRLLDAGDAEGAAARLVDAQRLWRGPALVEFADREFARPAAVALDERRLAVLEDRFDAALRAGRHSSVLGELKRAADEHPLRERLQHLLALGLYRAGRQADALAALDRTRTLLRDELGLDPGLELRDLEAAILRQDTGLDLSLPPRVATPPAVEARQELAHHGPALIGRDAESARLRGLLHEVVAGGVTRFALIEGEPGIGKTRMLEDAAAQARALALQVVWGRCSEAERAPAFWPWLEVLRGLGSAVDGARVELSDLLGDGSASPDPQTRRFALFESVADRLRTAANRAPLVILLEDLHWSDLPSAELLAHLADRLHDVPVAVLVSLRELDLGRDDAVPAAVSAINRRTGTQRLRLKGLSAAAAPALVREVVAADVSDDVVRAVHRRAEGNPFGISELSRLLASESALDDAEAVDRVEVPAGVRDVVRRRLTALPAPTRELLETFAVIGREADLPVLVHASGMEPDACLEAMEAALTSRVLVPVQELPGRHRFAHALTREAALAEMNSVRAARRHARVADAVRTIAGDGDETVEIVANHLWAASALVGPLRAAEALEKAAAVALRRTAYENADDLLSRALVARRSVAADAANALAELQTTIALVRLRRALRGYSRAIAAVPLDRPKELARAAGRPDLYQGLLLIEWGARGTGGDIAGCLTLGQRMREFGRSADQRIVRWLGEYAWAVTCWHVGRMVEASRTMLAVEAELGELSPEEWDALAALDARSLFTSFAIHIHVLAGTGDDAHQRWRELEAGLDDPYDKLVVTHFGGLTAACEHDVEAARVWAGRGLRADGGGGFAFFGAACQMYLGWADALSGQPTGGLARLEAGLERFVATGTRTGLALMYGMRIEAMLAGGHPPDEASEVLEAAARELIPADELWGLPYLDIARARIALASGDQGSAKRYLDDADEGGRQTGVVPVRRIVESLRSQLG